MLMRAALGGHAKRAEVELRWSSPRGALHMLPKLSGTELCKRIKKERPEVPVVLVTASDGARYNLHPDFDLVLHKPLECDFVERVAGLIYDAKD